MFKLLADECVNTDVVTGLRKNKIDLMTVFQAGLTGASDESVLTFLKIVKTAVNFQGKLAILGKTRIRVINR